MRPSSRNFGTYDDSAYPELWRGCVRAFAPCLGPSRHMQDWSRRNVISPLSGSAGHIINGWVQSQGQWAFYPTASGSPIVTVGNSGVGRTTAIAEARLWSISQWVHPLAHTSGQVMYREAVVASSTVDRIGLITGSSGAVDIKLRNTDGGSTQTWTTNGTTPLNQWSHLAVAINKWTGTLRAWINGVEQTFSASGTVNVGDWPTTEAHAIMRWASTFSGYVDDLKICYRAFTPYEVGMYCQGRGIAYTRRRFRRAHYEGTGDLTIEPTGIASALGIGQPTVTTGAVDVTATGIASTLAIGQPTVSPDASNVSVTGIASTLALGEPTVTQGGVTIDATGIASTLALGQPTITVGDVSVSPTGIASTLAIGTPTITSGLSILPTGIASTLATGQPTLTTGAVSVSPTGIASTLVVGQPAITTGEVTVSVTGIGSALALGQPTVTVTAPTIEVTGIASTLAIGQPTVTTGDVTVSASGISSTAAVGQPTVSLAGASQNITLTGIASTLGIGQPTVGFFVRADSSFSAGRNSTSATVKRWGN